MLGHLRRPPQGGPQNGRYIVRQMLTSRGWRTLGVAALLVGTAVAVHAAVGDAPEGKAGEWRQWRGPGREGLSKESGLQQAWAEGGPKLAWKATGLGEGFSSVTIADGRIYTLGDRADGAHAMALDMMGKQIWTTKFAEAGVRGGRPGPRGTPTVDPADGKHIYVISQHGDVACLTADAGKVVWKKALAQEMGGKMMSGWGYSESVLIDDGKVICTPGGNGGTLTALDKTNGNLIWRTKEWTDAAAYSSPIIATIGGVRQYVQFTGGSVAGVDPQSGKVLWKAERPGKTAVVPTPVVLNDHVFVSSGYGVGCDLFKVTRSGESFKAEKVFSNTDMVNHHGGVILLDGHVYGYSDKGGWTCMDMMTGKVKWSDKGVGKGAIAYADGRFYCRSEGNKGTMGLIEASPAGYKEHGRFDQPDRSKWQSWAHPVIVGGKMYLRDMDVLLCYEVGK